MKNEKQKKKNFFENGKKLFFLGFFQKNCQNIIFFDFFGQDFQNEKLFGG